MLSPHTKHLTSHLICFFSVLHRFEKKVPLVSMGGSITAKDGYRNMWKNFCNKYHTLYPSLPPLPKKSNFRIESKMNSGVSLSQQYRKNWQYLIIIKFAHDLQPVTHIVIFYPQTSSHWFAMRNTES